jgi:hypothetical protein
MDEGIFILIIVPLLIPVILGLFWFYQLWLESYTRKEYNKLCAWARELDLKIPYVYIDVRMSLAASTFPVIATVFYIRDSGKCWKRIGKKFMTTRSLKRYVSDVKSMDIRKEYLKYENRAVLSVIDEL